MTISFKVSDNTKEKMVEYFEDKKRDKTPAYALFQADEADTVVTLYESGKVVFQGVSADIDANLWKETEKHLNPGVKVIEKNSDKKEKKDKKEIYVDPKIFYSTSIGSDEVGTGDYFGPIVVTACFVDKKDIPALEELGVKDSKKMTDDKILEIVPKFLPFVDYESVILTNKEYNEKYTDDFNMNKIKAIMHNKALCTLVQRHPNYDYVVVDEFANPRVYFNYLRTSSNVFKNITFLTKGETRSISVACASLISRFIFIREFDKLGESVDMFLPKGASNLVDDAGFSITKKYGFDKLREVAKLNFKNTLKIQEKMKKEEN
jgi:ribonuclease HIII